MVSASEISDAWQQMNDAVGRHQIAIQTFSYTGVHQQAIDVQEAFSRLSKLMREADPPGTMNTEEIWQSGELTMPISSGGPISISVGVGKIATES